MRDLGALLALPALWVDHEPAEIVDGLLSVLSGVLTLDGAYARFDGDRDGTDLIESWRPSGPEAPLEIRHAIEAAQSPTTGLVAVAATVTARDRHRVVTLPLALPWESALVVVSAARLDFPTEMESSLLRIAVGQAAIAVHTARRVAREQAARSAAEDALRRRDEVLRDLVQHAGPALAAMSRDLDLAAEVVDEFPAGARSRGEVPPDAPGTPGRAGTRTAPSLEGAYHLSRRELEVLGLLAQGLSNREIAGVLWLSDRTVERHVTSLYRKIGVARRSEATAFAVRHGVM